MEPFAAADITFKEMSEEDAVATFQKDGYFDYMKRSMRYRRMSPESKWAKLPARMFVAFYQDTPVGVWGFVPYNKFLLGAGMHVRKEYRNRGLSDIMLDHGLREKGSKTLLINIVNPKISSVFRRKGFRDMDKENLPEELLSEIKGLEFIDQVQKWVYASVAEWEQTLKK